MRLGELLIEQRLISESQLNEALSAQLIFGGHLGTCLIEKGFLDEYALGQALSQLTRVPFAPPERFDNLSPAVVRSVPLELVRKHQVIPLDVQTTRLTVAMIDPRDFAALDELAFATSFKVVPHIAPEARILQALERYYDVPRRLRYVNVCSRLDAQRPIAPPPASGPPDSRSEDGAGDSAAAEQSGRRAPALIGVASIAGLLCRGAGEDELAARVLGEASRGAERSILFRVRGGTAHYWDSRGVEPEPADELRFSIISEPLFSLLCGEPLYHGPVPREPKFRGFFERLGLDPPAEMVLVPVHLDDRLVALYYADSGNSMGLGEGNADPHRRLAELLGLGLGLIGLEQRIRALCA